MGRGPRTPRAPCALRGRRGGREAPRGILGAGPAAPLRPFQRAGQLSGRAGRAGAVTWAPGPRGVLRRVPCRVGRWVDGSRAMPTNFTVVPVEARAGAGGAGAGPGPGDEAAERTEAPGIPAGAEPESPSPGERGTARAVGGGPGLGCTGLGCPAEPRVRGVPVRARRRPGSASSPWLGREARSCGAPRGSPGGPWRGPGSVPGSPAWLLARAAGHPPRSSVLVADRGRDSPGSREGRGSAPAPSGALCSGVELSLGHFHFLRVGGGLGPPQGPCTHSKSQPPPGNG